MVKQFSCGDVVPGCSATWSMETEEELLAAVAQHATVDHGMAEVTPELVDQVRSRILTVA